MTSQDLVGAVYGPVSYRIDGEKISEYVDATGDDPRRWVDHAPASFAGALLFGVTPLLLADGRLTAISIIHGEQTFEWHRPIARNTDCQVVGTVTRARERGGVLFLGFDLSVEDAGGPLISGSSTFLLGGDTAPGGGGEEAVESAPGAGEMITNPGLLDLPPAGGEIPPLTRSAGRSTLVRYAGASRDFNPIHWDHDSAVAAGLPGVVVHGLLQSAWICQAAARHRPGPRPLAEARFRYRVPLRPATPVAVVGTHQGAGSLDLRLADGETTYVSATVRLA